MAHRTQIMLRDDQYEWLMQESRQTGLSLAALIRRSIDHSYGGASGKERLAYLRRAAGAWREAPGEDRARYLGRLRGPGLGHRMAEHSHDAAA